MPESPIYLDASVLVALSSDDPQTERGRAFLRAGLPLVIVSDYAATEFASAIARRVRMGQILAGDAKIAFTHFDSWVSPVAQWTQTTASDITSAASLIRRLDLNVRAPDAINIAIADRIGAALATFDDRMAAAARALEVAVAAV
jgi:uncharacterized protein